MLRAAVVVAGVTVLVLSMAGAVVAAAGGRRFSGANRFETAVLVNREVHPSIGRAVLARGDDFADALAGSFLAGIYRSPLVFTYRDEIPPETLEYFRTAGIDVVELMGGTGAISEQVEQQLREEGIEYIRRGGANRFETASGLVDSGNEVSPDLILVNGYTFADAISAAPMAYRFAFPIGLTTAEELPGPTRALIERLNPRRLYVVGGQSAVSDAVVAEAALAGCDTQDPCRSVRRFAGEDRYGTSAALATGLVEDFGADPTIVHLARGDLYPDALAAGVLVGSRRSISLLTDPVSLSQATRSFLESQAAPTEFVDVMGSPDAVSDAVWREAQEAADR